MLAKAGLGSRRACEELIAEGRVTVNGEVAHLGRHADGTPHQHRRGRDPPCRAVQGLVYYLVNKPIGIYCHGR